MCKPAQSETEASPTILDWLAVKMPLIKYTSGLLLLPKQYAQQSIFQHGRAQISFNVAF